MKTTLCVAALACALPMIAEAQGDRVEELIELRARLEAKITRAWKEAYLETLAIGRDCRTEALNQRIEAQSKAIETAIADAWPAHPTKPTLDGATLKGFAWFGASPKATLNDSGLLLDVYRTCESCEGKGKCDPGIFGHFNMGGIPCPSCQRGKCVNCDGEGALPHNPADLPSLVSEFGRHAWAIPDTTADWLGTLRAAYDQRWLLTSSEDRTPPDLSSPESAAESYAQVLMAQRVALTRKEITLIREMLKELHGWVAADRLKKKEHELEDRIKLVTEKETTSKISVQNNEALLPTDRQTYQGSPIHIRIKLTKVGEKWFIDSAAAGW